MIRSLFISLQELSKGARRPANIAAAAIKKVGILGAGFMGAGIASVSAQAGLDVVLIDRDQATAEKGKAGLEQTFNDRISRGRATAAQRDAVLGKITATADYEALKGVDLIVEAVFEDRKVKADVTAKAQAVVPDVIFGSNTSTLPITSLAESAKDPEKFIGVHFFSPVDRMMLVEIILGKKTGNAALALALDFVRAIRKTPIVVNDARGFYANRCVLNYIQEGHLMLLEGIPAAMIENTARMAGMPVGPLSLNDETALDLGLKIVRAAESDLGSKAINQAQKKLLEEMVEKRGRLGRKNRKGFYDYPEGAPKRLWPGLADLVPKKPSLKQIEALDVEELKARFLAVQAVEAARTFEEGVITDVREADVGSILGFGFAPFSGGTLSYIDMMGTRKFTELCQRLSKKYGDRFAPSNLLLDMAKKDETFYGRFAPGKKAA
jgi:3-hydroxyacyl-CoA dehydrogenase/enoyl-CoA hydratase/3-hydroxybutyryl-CoA epimerase